MMVLWRVVVFVGWIVLMRCPEAVRGFTVGHETALRSLLFNTSGYDVSVRPAQPTVVSLTLVPTSLNSIDIKAQTMSISGWWVLTWMDSRLTWNPSNYDSISETHVFQDEVWTPTIVVYNSVNDLAAIDEDTIPVRIMSSGQLEWSPPGILTVSCNTDVTHFPFDTQTCGVSVKTFGYTVQQLDLEADSDEIDLTYYAPSGEWKLMDTWTQKVNVFNYSQVTFYFKVRRKPEIHGMNLVMPVVMMAVMGLFIFLLPAESGEKMGYSLTVMLTFVVLMTLIADRMPTTTDHTSFFEVYVVLVLVLCSLSVLLSILSLNLYFRDDSQPIPASAQSFTRLLMRLMCQKKHNQTTTTAQNRMGGVTPSPASDLQFTQGKESAEQKQRESPPSRKEGSWAEAEVTWKRMSTVMDAFFFRVYIVVLGLLTIVFLSITGAH